MWTINENKEWAHLRLFEWVSDMHGVPQSPVHHAEGDVAIHTQMVLKALESLQDYKLLDQQQGEIVWAAALLHDVEKRSTTIVNGEGSIVSPGHARKGAMTVRQILYRDIPTPFNIREEIVGLVKYHGLPVWIFDKPDPVKALLKASLEVNTQLLYLLAKADMLGRICSDKEEMLYRVEMFREFCIENNCWGIPRAFESDLSQFRYFYKDDQAPGFVPFDDTTTDVIMLSGIAGSGKDHYLSKYHKDLPIISLDDMRRKMKIDRKDTRGNGRIIQEAIELAKQYLRSNKAFVWNATNITVQMRMQLIALFATYNARICLVYLEVPYRVLIGQNKGREFAIPAIALERMIDKLEVPQLWEAHKVVYHCS